MIIQIYAFTDIDQALSAVEIGVNQIGFIAGRYGIVHGELDYIQARDLAASLPSGVKSVALTMATGADEIIRMVEAVEPDIVHISSDLFDVGLDAIHLIRESISPDIEIMKAIPVSGEESVEQAIKFAQVSDLLLLDTKGSGMPGVGATGRTHDWKLSRRIVESLDIPVILAGGLHPGNVAEAIMTVKPAGVDSNTGTNRYGSPVEKDMDLVRKFVRAAQRAVDVGAWRDG